MTLKTPARKLINKHCEAAAMEKAAWSSSDKPEVVVDDSMGRLVGKMHAMISPNQFALPRPDQRPYGYEDMPDLVKNGFGKNANGDAAGDAKADQKSRARKRRSSYTDDDHDMSTDADHAVATAPKNGESLPTNFYETKEFMDAEKIDRPLIPLFQQFAAPVLAWFKEGVRTVVCCLDKGTVKAKDRTAKKRKAEAEKRNVYPYTDSVQMTKEGSLYDESKRSSDGRFAYVSMDYARLMVTRRLRNQAFEWFAKAFAETAKMPDDGVLYMDYADSTGKHPITLEIKNNSIRSRTELANSYGEGDIAILNWLNYFADKNTMVSAIDGDMFGILPHYLLSRLTASKQKLDAKSIAESKPVLYWTDHQVFRNMNKLLSILIETELHPIALALMGIFSCNDFFLQEDKDEMLYRIGFDGLWNGLRKVPFKEYEAFRVTLAAAHRHGRPRDEKLLSKLSDIERRLVEKQKQEVASHGLQLMREVQRRIIMNKPKRDTCSSKAAAAPKKREKTEKEKSKADDARKKKLEKEWKACKVTPELRDLIVGNLEYWFYGHSVLNPKQFTAVIGLEWKAVARTQSDLDREELGDLERVAIPAR